MPPKSDVWKHVVTKSGPDAHGNYELECIHCGLEFAGGANRILHHLACTGGVSGIGACDSVPADIKQQYQTKLEKEAQEKQRKQKLKNIARSNSAPVPEGPPAKKQKDGNVKSLLGKAAKHKVDRAVARFVYGTGTSFNRLSSPYFSEMLQAVADYGPGYKRPSIHAIRGALLEEERAGMLCLRTTDEIVMQCFACQFCCLSVY